MTDTNSIISPFTSTPLISVVMPVYNAAEYLHQAVESLLSQTCGDFEVIAIDDGSRDNSVEILHAYADKRIRIFQQPNQGLAATLNRGIGLARGKYVARQDADDFSYPARFAEQVRFLDQNPQVWLLGTAAEIWRERTPIGKLHRHPTESDVLAFEMLFDNYFVHSSVMMRRELFETVGLYCTEWERQPEDFELWSRVVRKYHVANLPDVLHVYRERQGSICRTGKHPFRDRVVKISGENFAHAVGESHPREEHLALASVFHMAPFAPSPAFDLCSLEQLLIRAAAAIQSRFNGVSPALAASVERRISHLKTNYGICLQQPWPLPWFRKLSRRIAGLLRTT